MNAAFFGLAVLAAFNPKLFAVDLLLIENARPRPMFLCFLLGGMGMSLAVGLLDVFVVHADAISTQGSASAGLDLALGVPLRAGRIARRAGRHAGRQLHRRAAPAGHGEIVGRGAGVAVVAFVLIEFSLVIIPFVFLQVSPEATKARLQRAQDWLMSHARQLMAAVALFVGAYMVISGLVRLLT
jgi:hypothetical protein